MTATDGPVFDAAAVLQTGKRLEDFAAGLSERERSALAALLARAQPATPLSTLAATAPAALLQPAELGSLERLESSPAPQRAGRRTSLSLMMKATRLCNLRCTYCHYWKDGPNQVMSFPVLARATRDALRDEAVRVVEFVWHGGEPTLLPPAFYRKAVWLQERYRRPNQRVYNSIQTNATHLSDDWLAFLRDFRFDVGVSLDGPPEIHDRRRIDVGGQPTSARVREGLQRLRDAGVRETGVLMVVDDDVCGLGARRLLDYLLEIGVRNVGLHNVRPDNSGGAEADSYLAFGRYVQFLRDLFHVWYPEFVDRITFRELADLSGIMRGGAPQTCFFAGNCHGGFLTIEPLGEVIACDKYVDDDDFRFGNLLQIDLVEVQHSAQLARAEAANAALLDRQRDCKWFSVCRGACPHDRYIATRVPMGIDDRCCGYAPLLEDMADTLGALQPAPTGAP